MTTSLFTDKGRPAPVRSGAGRLRAVLGNAENLLVSAALGVMVLLPLLEIVTRRTLHIGVSGSTTIVRHLALIVGMLGGVIAAREGRLLALSTVTLLLKSRALTFARIFSGSFAAAVAAVLCLASIQFTLQTRSAGQELVYGIPLWVVLLVLPAGFAAVTLRLIAHAGDSLRLKVLAAILSAVVLSAGVWLPVDPGIMVLPAFVLLLVATILGAPVFVTLGGAALILFWGNDLPIASVPIDQYQQVTNPFLPAIPLFTLAGYFLAEGGASRRLIRVFQAWFGHFRGGPAIAAVLVCAFFTSFTGASGVTILALGGLLMPVLLASGCSEKGALGLLTSAGSLGLLWPPCLPMILYAIVSKVRIEEMFLGGILPGMVMVVLTAAWGILQSPPVKGTTPNSRFDLSEGGKALWEAKWELLLPVVTLSAIFGGYATLVEAAALTACYAFVVEVFVYRDLSFRKDVKRVMTECSLLIGGILLILGMALGLTDYLIMAQVPDLALEWVQSSIHSPLVFLLALNLLLLLVGCLLDMYSAVFVVVPLIVPMGRAFGIDPIHLGIIFLANLELGYLTPPVGMNLFLSSYRFGKPLPQVARAIIPILLLLLAGVLIITYVPSLSTFLPHTFR